ncbi:MAG: hypothetical protein Q8N31_21420 [Reyranella sp.]|nr:hypothetical protein [Reyranella sp.]
MRRYFVAWFVGVAFLFGGTAGAQTWIEYRPADGRFRIEMPGTPVVSSVPLDVGKAPRVMQIEAMTKIADVAFAATYTDMPDGLARSAPPEKLLERIRDGSVAGGQLLSDKPLTVGGLAAREYTFNNFGLFMVTRSAWSGRRLYQITVAGRVAGIDRQPDTRRFLDSFTPISP